MPETVLTDAPVVAGTEATAATAATATAADAAVAASRAATGAAAGDVVAPGVTPGVPVVPAVPAVPAVPEKYDLKLPDGSTLDPAIVERTAATARALGLSNEAGQQLLDQTVKDLDAERTAWETKATADAQAAQATLVEAWSPGGSEWKARDAQWRADALADPDIGAGDEKKFTASIEFGQRALMKYGPELKAYLNQTGIGSHPAAIKFLANIGRAMAEGALVLGTTGHPSKPKSDGQTMYPDLYNSDGSPKT